MFYKWLKCRQKVKGVSDDSASSSHLQQNKQTALGLDPGSGSLGPDKKLFKILRFFFFFNGSKKCLYLVIWAETQTKVQGLEGARGTNE